MQLCSRKEHSRKEILDKIVSRGCGHAQAEEIVNFLVEHKFVDDHRYTAAFVKDKMRFNKWGRVKIAYMLRMQGIENDMITDVFSETDDTEYLEILTGELQKKLKSLKGNTYEIKGKLFRFATSRGFEADIVNQAICEIRMKNEE